MAAAEPRMWRTIWRVIAPTARNSSGSAGPVQMNRRRCRVQRPKQRSTIGADDTEARSYNAASCPDLVFPAQ